MDAMAYPLRAARASGRGEKAIAIKRKSALPCRQSSRIPI